MTIEKLRKRDGRLVDFDQSKIATAINKAFEATYKPGQDEAANALAAEVVAILEKEGNAAPEVEHIQDIVEQVLIDAYDMLHTQGRPFIADYVLETLANWEKSEKEKGGAS